MSIQAVNKAVEHLINSYDQERERETERQRERLRQRDRERLRQRDRERLRQRERENSNSKTLFYKDCSLG